MTEAEGVAQPAGPAAAAAAAQAEAADAAGAQPEEQQPEQEQEEAPQQQPAPPAPQGWWRRDGTIPAQGVELPLGSLPPGEPLNTLVKDLQQQLRWGGGSCVGLEQAALSVPARLPASALQPPSCCPCFWWKGC